MDWIDPKDKLPPQGKKILYFKNGDIYVVQRFSGHWIPMPFTDSKYGKLPPPDLWCDIELPDGSESYIEFRVNDVFYSLDDLEIHHPEQYREFLEIFSIK